MQLLGSEMETPKKSSKKRKLSGSQETQHYDLEKRLFILEKQFKKFNKKQQRILEEILSIKEELHRADFDRFPATGGKKEEIEEKNGSERRTQFSGKDNY